MKISELFREVYFERVNIENSYLVTPEYKNGDLNFVRVCFEHIVKGEHEHVFALNGITKAQLSAAVKDGFICIGESPSMYGVDYFSLTAKGISAMYNAYKDWTVDIDCDKQKSYWMSNTDMDEAISSFLEQELKLLGKEKSYNYRHFGNKCCNDNTDTTRFVFNKPISKSTFVEYLRNNGYDVDSVGYSPLVNHFTISGEGSTWVYNWVEPYKD